MATNGGETQSAPKTDGKTGTINSGSIQDATKPSATTALSPLASQPQSLPQAPQPMFVPSSAQVRALCYIFFDNVIQLFTNFWKPLTTRYLKFVLSLFF